MNPHHKWLKKQEADRFKEKELRLKKKQIKPLTAEQKKNLLEFLEGDEDSREVAKTMIRNYLSVHEDKLFKREFDKKLDEVERGFWYDASFQYIKSRGIKLRRPCAYVNYVISP